MPKELLQSVDVSEETSNALRDYFNHHLTASVEAIWSGLSSTEISKNREILDQQEYAMNKLSISDSIQAQAAYRLGEINAIAKLMVLLNEKASCIHNIEQAQKDSPLLVKCICFIGDNVTVTGRQIIEHLEMKHRSNLSNLMTRQKKYNYIQSYRVGNKAIYMLSQNGQTFYDQYIRSSSNTQITKREDAVLCVVDEVVRVIKKNKINRIEIISMLKIKSPDMKSFYMSAAFTDRVDSLAKAIDQYTSIVLSAKLQEAMKAKKDRLAFSRDMETPRIGEYLEKVPNLVET